MSTSIRAAILKAAQHFTTRPDSFSFTRATNTPHCDTDPACYVGKIAFFMGEPGGQPVGTGLCDAPLCRRVMGVPFREFEARIRAINGAIIGCDGYDARFAGEALRKYADLYHPAKPLSLPDWRAMAAVQTVPADAVDQMVAQS